VIDLRSDTATRPTEGMRQAIAEAAVGDEQKREDPSVNELQARVAALLGQEAAIFLPTATMANQIALKLHSRPGDVLVAEETAHVVIYEYGGTAAHAGLMTLGLPGDRGRLTPEQVTVAAEPSTKVADQRVTVLALEDTHNSSGGRVWPLDDSTRSCRRRASSSSECTSTGLGSSTRRRRSASSRRRSPRGSTP
jgi:threonine aldolase